MPGKVLIGCPTYDKMLYCIGDFLRSVREVDYDMRDILLVDNSESEEHYERLKKEEGILVLRDSQKGKKGIQKVVHSRNLILDYAQEHGYDFVLMLDQDLLVPKDIIEKLMACEKDIVSGLYYNYFASSGGSKWLPCAFAYISDEEFYEIQKKIRFPPYVKSAKDLRRNLTEEEAKSGELMRVRYASGGCLLLSRKAFSENRYGLLDLPEGSNVQTGDDIYFFEKAEEKGYEVWCHTGVKCEHLVEGKFERGKDGKLYHPMYR